MIWKPIQLTLSEADIAGLKGLHGRLQRRLEAGYPLPSAELNDLMTQLSRCFNQLPEIGECLQAAAGGTNHTLILVHPDSEILSLPWHAAIDAHSGRAAGLLPHLYITKMLRAPSAVQAPARRAAPPLKVLALVSMPEDLKSDQLRAFQQQQFMLLNSLDPLGQSGEMEIDYADNCALETLQEKLQRHRYHLVYLAGQGMMKGGEAHLLLEDGDDFRQRWVHVRDVAAAFRGSSEYQVPGVILSFCQNPDHGNEAALREAAGELIRQGTAAVVTLGSGMKAKYAVQFNAHFLMRVSRKWPVFMAFDDAVTHIHQQEAGELQQAGREPSLPLQWMLPNLYLSGKIGRIADWELPGTPLALTSYQFPGEAYRTVRRRHKPHVFVGRRDEIAALLKPFREKTPLLLRGPAGIGKTALAQHLVSRLCDGEENTAVFVFGDKAKSVQEFIDTLQRFLQTRGHRDIAAKIENFVTAKAAFTFLLYEVAREWQPVFVFDNLEVLQENPGKRFEDRYQGIAEIIHFLIHVRRFPVILTCRYEMPDFPDVLDVPLRPPTLADFWKNCLQLGISPAYAQLNDPGREAQRMALFPQAGPTTGDLVKMLYKNLGGNYRALELFAQLIARTPDAAVPLLLWLEKAYRSSQLEEGRIPARAGTGLIFPHLFKALDEGQRRLLRLLGGYRIPVRLEALTAQLPDQARQNGFAQRYGAMLEALFQLSLVDIYIDSDSERPFYHVSSLIRELLQRSLPAGGEGFSHLRAGEYHQARHGQPDASLSELKEAFYHFGETDQVEPFCRTGEILSDYYYDRAIYQVSFYFAWAIYQRLGKHTPTPIWLRIGEILGIFRKYGDALTIYKSLLAHFQSRQDPRMIARVLNFIGDIFRRMEVYDTALMYLEESLKISRQLGRDAGEADTLRNMGHLYLARGDYQSALSFSETALQLIADSDPAGRRRMLIAISDIRLLREEYDDAARCRAEGVKICRELGDRRGECLDLSAIAAIYREVGDEKQALRYWQATLRVGREIGDKYLVNDVLKSIIAVMGRHLAAPRRREYLEESLRVAREIGDRETESVVLNRIAEMLMNSQQFPEAQRLLLEGLSISEAWHYGHVKSDVLYNLGVIMREQGDRSAALSYLGESLRFGRENGRPATAARALHQMALIVYALGDLDRAANYLNQSIRISREIKDRRTEALKLIDMVNFYLDTRVHQPAVAKSYLNQAIKINVVLRDDEVTRLLNQIAT